MNAGSRRVVSRPGAGFPLWVSLVLSVATLLIAGCASGTGTTFRGNATVTLFATGSANDLLTSFRAGISSLALTSKSGETVDLLTSPIAPDFIHENGIVQAEGTSSVPEGVYVSATASFSGGGFACSYLIENGAYGTADYGYEIPEPNLTVTLPAPITVSGASMGLLLDFEVSQSLSLPGGCSIGGNQTYTLQPAFVLTPLTLAAQPTNSVNDLALGQQGMIASVDAGAQGFSATNIYDGSTWQVTANQNTAYQGVTGLSQLAAGMPVEVDEAVQADGSLAATRVQVYDANTNTLSVNIGPLLNANFTLEYPGTNPVPNLLFVARGVAQGTVPYDEVCDSPNWNDSGAVFQVSGALANLKSLPFAATFDASSVTPGQRVAATTHDTAHVCETVNDYSSAATVTLLPQTINGTVESVSSEGGFTTYTVELASYDLFPDMGSQPDQVLPVANPDTVVVYADANAQMLNTHPISVGSLERFYGLVFNDNGTLRMDCAQVNDGVAE
jgi:hypothetical protein